MIYRRRAQAFTLIELLVVLSIAAILVTIAAPSMDQSSKRHSVRGLQKNYLSALNFARSEAVSGNKLVSMCPSIDAETCDTDTGDWTQGWLIFVDNGTGVDYGNGTYDAGDERLLRVHEYDGDSGIRVLNPDDSMMPLNSISWTYRGFTRNGQRALFVVCDRNDDVSSARAILLERSGRVIQSRDFDDDGIHESSFEGDGIQELTCG